MNKKILFVIILCAVSALGALDFFVNNYSEKIKMQANVQEVVDLGLEYAKKIKQINPEINLEEEQETTTIFNKIDLEKVEGVHAKDFLFAKNGVNYLKLYTFQFESPENQINYLKLKTLFADLNKLQSNITINEANNYGINSFYVNDTNEDTVVRIIFLTSNAVYGVEYAKMITRESIDPLLSILTSGK